MYIPAEVLADAGFNPSEPPPLSDVSSVLDRAYAHREVARFYDNITAADAEAARLNAWDASA